MVNGTAIQLAYGFCSFLLLVSSYVHADENPKTLCKHSGVSSLYVGEGLQFENREYCQSSKPFPAPFTRLLMRVREINQRTSKILGLPFREVFSNGVPLEVRLAELGPLESNTNQAIRLTVFPDWNGEEFPDSIYAHELGHWVSSYAPTPYREILHRFQRTPVTIEAMADLFALATMGSLSLGDSYPGCLKEIKSFSDAQWSFALPRGYFDNFFQWRKLRSCCERLQETHSHLGKSAEVCEGMARVLSGSNKPFIGVIPDLDQSQLETAAILSKPSMFDPHFLGNPITSFIAKVASFTKQNVGILLLGSIKKVVEGRKGNKIRCHVPALRKITSEVVVTTPSFSDVLAAMREELKGEEIFYFEKESKKHALGVMEDFFVKEARGSGGMEAADVMRRTLRDFVHTHPSHPIIEGSGCFRNKSWVERTDECSLACN